MSCIGFETKADPELHEKKLLEPGWAGEITDTEAEYIAQKLRDSAALRRAWAVRKFTRYRKRITPIIVKRMAAGWARNATWGAEGLATASGEKDKRGKDTNTLTHAEQMVLL